MDPVLILLIIFHLALWLIWGRGKPGETVGSRAGIAVVRAQSDGSRLRTGRANGLTEADSQGNRTTVPTKKNPFTRVSSILSRVAPQNSVIFACIGDAFGWKLTKPSPGVARSDGSPAVS